MNQKEKKVICYGISLVIINLITIFTIFAIVRNSSLTYDLRVAVYYLLPALSFALIYFLVGRFARQIGLES